MKRIVFVLLAVLAIITGYRTYELRSTLDFSNLKKDANNDGMNDAVNLLMYGVTAIVSLLAAVMMASKKDHV
mgnify:CR=1 FL=1